MPCIWSAVNPVGEDGGVWVQAVNFRETLKCIAKTVVGLDVSLDHPPHVGYMHDWFAACLIQKVIRGKIYRRRTAERLGRPVSVGFVQVRMDLRHLPTPLSPQHTHKHMHACPTPSTRPPFCHPLPLA